MASRRFTDSEIRAYTRNRYEEKVLRVKLRKMHEDLGDLHDLTTKHRSELIDDCRQMQKTSGGSTIVNEPNSPVNIIEFSTRVSRPWAYSIMETTYNAVYQDAIIPIPKRLGCTTGTKRSLRYSDKNATSRFTFRQAFSSKSSKGHRSLPARFVLQKEHTSPAVYSDTQLLHTVQKSANVEASQMRAQTTIINSLHRPSESISSGTLNADITSPSTPSIKAVGKTTSLEIENGDKQQLTKDEQSCDKVNMNGVNDEPVLVPSDGLSKEEPFNNTPEMDGEIDQYNRDIDDKKYHNTKYISLPAVYKIDSNEYQTAVRQQMIKRAKSRNELTQKPVAPVKDTNSYKQQHNDTVQTISEHLGNPKDKSADNKSEVDVTGNSSVKLGDQHEDTKSSKENDLRLFKSLDSSLNETNCVKSEYLVTYRGKTIHNYIRPEHRYKLDPSILKRRQNKMDKLAKESATFLKRVNHENIRVEIAFPRSTRKRLLSRLVDANNSKKGQQVTNVDVVFIQNKVENFMVSISDYICKQDIGEST